MYYNLYSEYLMQEMEVILQATIMVTVSTFIVQALYIFLNMTSVLVYAFIA